jgi:hypothetical protein
LVSKPALSSMAGLAAQNRAPVPCGPSPSPVTGRTSPSSFEFHSHLKAADRIAAAPIVVHHQARDGGRSEQKRRGGAPLRCVSLHGARVTRRGHSRREWRPFPRRPLLWAHGARRGDWEGALPAAACTRRRSQVATASRLQFQLRLRITRAGGDGRERCW